jgi:hypothetical protein
MIIQAGLQEITTRANFKTSPFEVYAYLSDICVPDERDLRFASTGSNFNLQNTTCIPVVNPPQADRLLPLKVRDLRLDLEFRCKRETF